MTVCLNIDENRLTSLMLLSMYFARPSFLKLDREQCSMMLPGGKAKSPRRLQNVLPSSFRYPPLILTMAPLDHNYVFLSATALSVCLYICMPSITNTYNLHVPSYVCNLPACPHVSSHVNMSLCPIQLLYLSKPSVCRSTLSSHASFLSIFSIFVCLPAAGFANLLSTFLCLNFRIIFED